MEIKSKEQQIEEMAKILWKSCLWQESGSLDCQNCEFFSKENNVCCSFGHKEAILLFNAGYGNVVQILKEFVKTLKSEPRVTDSGLEFVALVDIDAELNALLKEYGYDKEMIK